MTTARFLFYRDERTGEELAAAEDELRAPTADHRGSVIVHVRAHPSGPLRWVRRGMVGGDAECGVLGPDMQRVRLDALRVVP